MRQLLNRVRFFDKAIWIDVTVMNRCRSNSSLPFLAQIDRVGQSGEGGNVKAIPIEL